MQIRPTSGFSNVSGVSMPSQKALSATNVQQTPIDQLELSFEAQMLSRVNDGIRTDRVAMLKAQIANGAYESPEKIQATVNRLLDEYA